MKITRSKPEPRKDKRTNVYKELRQRRLWLIWLFIASVSACGITMAIGKKLVFKEYPINPMVEPFEVRSNDCNEDWPQSFNGTPTWKQPCPQPCPAPSGKPTSHHPIDMIRQIGEELGYDNEVIKTMIRIAKCESSYKENALNVNKGGSIDRGIFQINTIHAISNKDAFTSLKNIKFAYGLYKTQGFTPWRSSIKCWKEI